MPIWLSLPSKITEFKNLFLPKNLFWFLSLFSTSTSKFLPSKDLFNSIWLLNNFSWIVISLFFNLSLSVISNSAAAELEITDKDKLKNRLITIQEKLFSNQIELNKSLEGKNLEVLVENKLKNQNKFFGRNKFLNSVIFDGNESHIGKLIKVNIEKSNQNSLFGKVTDEMKAA